MTDEQKREHAEMVRELADAIKHALGMGYGPPMEGEEGWIGDAVVTDSGAIDPEIVRREVQAGVEMARRLIKEGE